MFKQCLVGDLEYKFKIVVDEAFLELKFTKTSMEKSRSCCKCNVNLHIIKTKSELRRFEVGVCFEIPCIGW